MTDFFPGDAPNDPDPVVAPPSNTHVCMVLLVDDQAMVGETVRRMLAEWPDVDFHYCADPATAVATARRIRPTVILQDLIMPGIDGITLVAKYRAHPETRNVPIIVLSTRENATVKRDAFAAGANDYLVKLPDRIELIARIRLHSNAYINLLQRDDAYRALRESQQQLMSSNASLRSMNEKLAEALSKVKQLSGLLPICSYCKRIRSDENYWTQVDQYVMEHTDVQFSHGICPACYEVVRADFEE